MRPIELYTREGAYVTTVQVPDFKPPAEILVWGVRMFVLDAEHGKYREAFAYVVPLQQF